MNYFMNKKEIIGIGVVIFLFLVGAVAAREYAGHIALYLNHGAVSMLVYVFAGIFATVIVPVSTVPLIPIAVVLWGSFTTAVLSIFAWTIGSVIAFSVARYFGKPVIARFLNIEKISKYERVLGKRYLFWNVVFLRVAVPVDILSYAIGLFTEMNISAYTLATFIGIIPFAFIFSYSSRGSVSSQLLAGFLVIAMMYIGYLRTNISNPQND